MAKRSSLSTLLLLLASVIWGSAFLAQGMGGEHVDPFTFTGIRFLMGALVLLPIIFFSDLNKKNKGIYIPLSREQKRALLIGGVVCGCVLTVAAFLQQAALGGILGIEPTTPAKAGFITALYIVIVPILSIFLKKRAPLSVWLGVLIAALGM